MDMPRVRVLVVDDQRSFRRAVAAVIEQTEQFELVGEADSGESAVALIGQLQADLMLLDVNMPGMGGERAAQLITTARPDLRVVLISTYPPDALPRSVRDCGLPYVHKEMLTPEELLRAWEDPTSG